MSRPRSHEAGFTLLEVLVALAVLAMVGTALVEAQRLAALGTRRAEGRTRALATAASLLAERSAGARGDGRGRIAPDVGYTIASRPRPDLVLSSAIVPVERIVTVTIRPNGAARLGAIDWAEGASK